jgi:glutamine cyclotransferase
MSDGTHAIRILNPETLTEERRFGVTLRGQSLQYLNELEWIDGKIWANIYTTDHLVIIDPRTGVVEGVVDLEGLLPETERTPQTDVLNGIAYDASTGRIFVTGKNWSKLYEIELFEK